MMKYDLLTNQIKEHQPEFCQVKALVGKPFDHYYDIALANLNPFRDRHLCDELTHLKQHLA